MLRREPSRKHLRVAKIVTVLARKMPEAIFKAGWAPSSLVMLRISQSIEIQGRSAVEHL
jgi:hypothetical protein